MLCQSPAHGCASGVGRRAGRRRSLPAVARTSRYCFDGSGHLPCRRNASRSALAIKVRPPAFTRRSLPCESHAETVQGETLTSSAASFVVTRSPINISLSLLSKDRLHKLSTISTITNSNVHENGTNYGTDKESLNPREEGPESIGRCRLRTRAKASRNAARNRVFSGVQDRNGL